MPENDLVLENWNAAVDAARDAVKSAGINPPLAKQHALRALAETAARAVFAGAKADVKTVRATIAWGKSPLDVQLEVITTGRQRYPRDAASAVKPEPPLTEGFRPSEVASHIPAPPRVVSHDMPGLRLDPDLP